MTAKRTPEQATMELIAGIYGPNGPVPVAANDAILAALREQRRLRDGEVEADFQKLIALQAHYANLLNDRDGGERIAFKSVDEWRQRLASLRERGTP